MKKNAVKGTRVFGLVALCLLGSNLAFLLAGTWNPEGALLSLIPAFALGGLAAFLFGKDMPDDSGIRLEEEIHRLQVESSPNGIFAFEVKNGEASDQCTLWNDQLSRLTGFDQKQISEIGWKSVIFPDWDEKANPIGKLETNQLDDITWAIEERSILTAEKKTLSICLSLSLVNWKGVRYLIGSVEETHHGEAYLGAMTLLAREFCSLYGKDFYMKACEYLLSSLEMDYVLVGIISPDKQSVKTEVLLGKDGPADSMTYELNGAPCEKVMGRQACCFPAGVQEKFPEDELLKQMGIESYVGAPLSSKSDEPMGILVAISTKPIADEEKTVSMMRLFSDRIAIEMERTRAAEAIKDSEEKLKLALEASKMGTWTWNSITNDIEWSERTEIIYGVEPDSFEGTFEAFSSQIHPADKEWMLNKVSQAVENQSEYQILHRIIRRDGAVRWLRAFGKVLQNDQGESIGMSGTVVDVSDERDLEVKVEKSEEMLKLAMDSTQMGAWTWNSETNENIWSSRTEIIYGLEPGTFGGTFNDFIKLIHPEDRKMVRDTIQASTETDEDYHVLHRVIFKDGSIHWVQGYGRVVYDDEGKMTGMVGTVLDITKKYEAEESIQRSEASLTAVIDNTPDLIVAINTEYQITAINESMKLSFKMNRNRELYVGDNMLDHLGEDNLEDWQRRYDRALAGERFLLEEKFDVPDGTVWFEVSLNPIETDGNIVGVSIFCRNITEHKNFENQLVSQKEKAEESDRLKSAFLANMSHEIRTPLNAIMGFAQLLNQTSTDKETRRKYTDIIQANGKHLMNIVSDLLDIAQIETNQLSINHDDFNLGKLLEEIYMNFDREIHEESKGRVNLMPDQGYQERLIFTGDETRLRQVLYNLLRNATKFTNEGTISYGYRILDDDYIEFHVSDTGKGIENESQDRIFNRFVQVESDLVRNFDGAGLGLAICKGLVELMGGKIWLESKIDVGSSFKFTIRNANRTISSEESPSANIEPNQATENSSSAEPEQRATILIVEDNDPNFLLFKHTLTRHPIDIVRAINGEESIQLVSENPDIELVLMDIRMPVLDGYEATKRILKLRPELPVIVQSAFAMKEDRQLAKEAGCIDFLAKPIDAKELLRLIDKYLQH